MMRCGERYVHSVHFTGLYARSKMMRAASNETQELCIPLRLLHPFW